MGNEDGDGRGETLPEDERIANGGVTTRKSSLSDMSIPSISLASAHRSRGYQSHCDKQASLRGAFDFQSCVDQ